MRTLRLTSIIVKFVLMTFFPFPVSQNKLTTDTLIQTVQENHLLRYFKIKIST